MSNEPTLYREAEWSEGLAARGVQFLYDEEMDIVVVPVEPDYEAMAEALWESETPVLGFEQPWADQPEVTKDEYREAAKRVWRAGIGDTDE